MEPKAFERAKKEYALATLKLKSMKTATDIEQLSVLWSEFLVHVQRTFTKMKKASEKGSAKGWFDKVIHDHHNDELLKYVHQARHADEHGIEPVTHQQPGSIRINPKHGNSLYVDYMEMKDGRLTLGPLAAKNAKIEWDPAQILLIPVENRGVVFPPPQNHLGNPIQGTNPILVAELTLNYLEKVMSEAAQYN